MTPDPESLDWSLLTRYVAGQLSRAEAEAVERWFESDPRHGEVLEELRAVWSATRGELDGWNAERAIAELRRRIEAGVLPVPLERSPPRSVAGSAPRPFSLTTRRPWIAIAAGLGAAAVGIGALARWLDTRPRLLAPAPPVVAAAPQVTDLVTKRAQQAEVRLMDGSRVVLGPASTLSYGSDFNQSERTVTLDGEAYFHVVHDSTKPFRVRTAQGVTEDKGTAFMVRAREDLPLQVVVTEGAVVLRATAPPNAADASVLLTQGQLGRVRPNGTIAQRTNVRLDPHIAWLHGELMFEDTPLREVAADLSRWYDADVQIDAATAGRRFTGRFVRRGLDEAVRLVADVADVAARRSGDGWMLMEKSDSQ